MARTSKSKIIQAMEDGTYFVENEIPTGSINGANQTFTLAGNPNPDSSLEVFANGQKLALTEDYTLSGDTLSTVVAFPLGTILKVNYRIKP